MSYLSLVPRLSPIPSPPPPAGPDAVCDALVRLSADAARAGMPDLAIRLAQIAHRAARDTAPFPAAARRRPDIVPGTSRAPHGA